MVGKKQPEERLNKTLIFFANLLNKNNVKKLVYRLRHFTGYN